MPPEAGAVVETQDRSTNSCTAHRRFQLYLLLAAGDVLALVLGFGLASRVLPDTGHIFQLMPLLLVLAPMHAVIAFQLGAYGLIALRSWTRGLRYALTALFLAALSILAISIAWDLETDLSLPFLLLGLLQSVVSILVARQLIDQLSLRLLPEGPVDVVLLTDRPESCAELAHPVVDARQLSAACNLDCPDALDRLGRAIGRADRVLVACAAEDRQRWVTALKGSGVDVEILLPEFEDLGVLRIEREQGRLTACVATGRLALRQRVLKRAFDVATVLWLAPMLLLMLAVVSIAIKLDDGGPIFFVQRRIGQGNRFFNLYKFRTMRVESLDRAGAQSTARGDPRVTRVGRFLRSTSIDELPQLFNVLTGSMSIVGPRPHAPGSRAEDQLFWAVDQRYWLRHATKPGLTGLAQVRGFRGATDSRAALLNRIQADLEYLAGWSLWRDIRILAATVGVLAHPNAY